MLNRDGVRKYSYYSRKQILANVEFQESVGCIVPQTMGVDVTGNGKTIKLAKAGTPVHINLENINEKVITPAATTQETATATVSGTGISAATVTAATFGTKVGNTSGTYTFNYDTDKWVLNGADATLAEYGIVITGVAADGDKIIVEYTAAGDDKPMNAVLLHDVDVTDGAANGTACLFGFINLNRLDDDVKAKIAEASQVAGVSPLLTFMAV